MVIISKPHPSLLEDDLIVPSVDIIRSLVTIPDSVPSPLDTGAEESSFEVVDMSGKGQGMVAKRKLYPGEVIMTEKPLIVVPDKIFEDHEKTDAFIERKINQMSCEDRETFLNLSDCRNHEDPQYCGRFYTNAMNYGGDAALFPKMAMANHSCRPNAEFIDRTDIGLQLLVVIYVIEAGDEICINYMSMDDEGCDSKEVRQEYLRRYYGFMCCCQACTLQDKKLKEDDLVRETIKELQAVDREKLDLSELEEFLKLIYQIHGKLSFALTIFETLHERAQEGSLRRLEYAVSGLWLASDLYGAGAKQVAEWKAHVEHEKSIFI